MKKVLLVIASQNFQPVEYEVTRRVLEDADIEVLAASDEPGDAVATNDTATRVDVVLKDVDAQKYDGIFFIGGGGALEHLDTQESNRVLNEAMVHQVPYGAICISPRILAKAHVLIGKKATGWDLDNELADIFAQNNVQYVRESVVVDGNVITANGPQAAEEFGRKIVEVLL